MFPKNSHLIFVRHGNTDKKAHDNERRLTEIGREQADTLNKKLCRKFDLALCSSSLRAKETLERFVSCKFDRVVYSDALYKFPSEQKMKAFMEMLGDIGSANVADYRKHKNGIVLQEISESAGDFVLKTVVEERDAGTFLILSHSVFLQMIIARVFPVLIKETETMIFPECGAFEVKTDEDGSILASRMLN